MGGQVLSPLSSYECVVYPIKSKKNSPEPENLLFIDLLTKGTSRTELLPLSMMGFASPGIRLKPGIANSIVEIVCY
jgi:hypothetical protein